jgi:hypothetical protein
MLCVVAWYILSFSGEGGGWWGVNGRARMFWGLFLVGGKEVEAQGSKFLGLAAVGVSAEVCGGWAGWSVCLHAVCPEEDPTDRRRQTGRVGKKQETGPNLAGLAATCRDLQEWESFLLGRRRVGSSAVCPFELRTSVPGYPGTYYRLVATQ